MVSECLPIYFLTFFHLSFLPSVVPHIVLASRRVFFLFFSFFLSYWIPIEALKFSFRLRRAPIYTLGRILAKYFATVHATTFYIVSILSAGQQERKFLPCFSVMVHLERCVRWWQRVDDGGERERGRICDENALGFVYSFIFWYFVL